MAEGEASLLTILFENSSSLWEGLEQRGLSFKLFVEHLLIFIRAYSLLNDANQLAVFGVGQARTTLLYASQPPGLTSSAYGQHAHPTSIDSASSLLQRIKEAAAVESREAESSSGSGDGRTAAWSSALLRALCFVNKQQTTGGEDRKPVEARILCISSAPDDASQYLAAMNSFFAAQRASVVIDACVLGKTDSSFMQQAAFITGGTYLHPAKPSALVQYLLTAYAADASSREFLRLPQASGVDFRAACFCHKRPTALGFVCSVCLSIFCEKVPACSTCGTNFSHVSSGVGKLSLPG